MVVNLGSTIEEFFEAINTNTEDTRKIVRGEKKIKQLRIGDEEIGEEAASIEYEVNAETGVKTTNIKGETIHIDSTFNGEQGTENSAIFLGSGLLNMVATEQINIYAKEGGTTFFQGKVSFHGANVTGLPSGGDAIVDVATLPTENVNENVIYRVPSAMFYHVVQGKLPIDQFLCNVVDTLPEVGNPVGVFDSSYNVTFIEGYYVASENKAYGYVDNILSQIGASLGQTIPVGWYPLEVLFPIINQSYGGIINSTTEATDISSIYLLVEYSLYTYKNGIYTQPSINTNADFIWGGSNTFNAVVAFTQSALFSGTVDFSNASVIGLPSGSSGSIDTTADITWEGDHSFNGNVQFFADCGMDYINCDTEAKFNGDAYFYGLVNFSNGEVTFNNGLVAKGNVDFSNATVIGLSSGGGLDIPSEVISYNSENNSLSFTSNSIYYSSQQHNFSGNVSFDSDVDFSNATVIGLPSGGSLDLNADYNWNGYHTFNNGLTVDGILRLANNGHIDITDDYVEIRHPQLTLSGDDVHLYANQSENSAIEILAGENDDTYFYISPSGLDVTANNGNINFTTGNQGSIGFTANGEESASGINIYDSVIEYHSQNHQFFGEVDFSDATVTGLPSSGGGLTKTKVTLAELRALLADYTNNRGKIVQLVYKGTYSAYPYSFIINHLSLNQIGYSDIKNSYSVSEMTESAISIIRLDLYISSSNAYITYNQSDYDFTQPNIGIVSTIQITDDKFDFYIIG